MSRVMIVEPMPLLRLAIGQVIERLGHVVVAQVDNGQDALVHARSDSPQLVVLELAIAGLGGLDLIRRLKLRDPTQKLLVYTGQSSSHFVRLCVQAGADGFVSKQDAPAELERALSAVTHGRRYFPGQVAVPVGGKELDTLSARELTVLELISEGHSNQVIAEQLSISYKTVSTYKTRLQEKLQVNSRLALASIAQRNGIGVSAVAAVNGPDPQAQALEEPTQHALLRALLDASPHPMFVRDREGHLLLCNQPFLTLHHTSHERVVGGRLLDAFWFTAEQGRSVQARYDAFIEKGESFSAQTSVDFFGEPHFIRYWAEPWRDANGTVLGMVGSIEDLTDRHVLLGQLRDAHEQAEARYRDVGRFARVVHGDLSELLEHLRSLALPPSGQVALQRLTQRLAQLEQLVSLDQLRPPLVPVQLDIVEWSTARLAALNVQLSSLAVEEVTTRQLWIDGERLGALFDTLVQYLRDVAPQAELRIKLATRMQLTGVVTLSLTITLCQLLKQRRSIALQLCRNLAQSLEGSFRGTHEHGESAFLIELESSAVVPD